MTQAEAASWPLWREINVENCIPMDGLKAQTGQLRL
jgi:hypothetical protein